MSVLSVLLLIIQLKEVPMIQIDLKDSKPIYEQIKEKIKGLIISGILKPDDKIPSVRELAQTLTINPNTIQKAYRDLESESVIYTVKGKGNFISPMDQKTVINREAQLLFEIQKCAEELVFLKTPKNKVLNCIENVYTYKEGHK